MKWRKSNYVTKVLLDEANVLLVYGGIGSRLIEIPASSIKEAESLLDSAELTEGREDSKLMKIFKEQGIFVPEDFNEVEYLKERYTLSKSNKEFSLSLTICPTLRCNFRCVYCYQHHLANKMSAEVQDALVAYVENYSPKLRKLYVTWFGGEPLIALPVIGNLSRRFLELKERNIDYSASIITNGSLLTEENSSKLADLGIKNVQITLDGPKEIHDQRRPMKGGRPSYDKIIENLLTADSRLNISIRVNVDIANVDHCERLLDELDREDLKGKFSLYFAPVRPYTDVCNDIIDQCLTLEGWSDLQVKLQLMAYDRGFGSLAIPKTKSGFCIADSSNGFLVDAEGFFYKCWNDATQPNKAVYSLVGEQQSDKMVKNLNTWKSWDVFELEECLSCKVLPQCLGGCPYLGLEQGTFSGKGYCQEIKFNLKHRIALHYLDHRNRLVAEKVRSLLPGTESSPFM